MSYDLIRERKPKTATEKNYLELESMENTSGFEGTIDGLFIRQYATGEFAYPSMGTMGPVVPINFDDWTGDFGLINDNFCVDASSTADDLDMYVIIDRGGELWKQKVATLSKEEEEPDSNLNFYYKGYLSESTADWKISGVSISNSITDVIGSSFVVSGDKVQDYSAKEVAVNNSTENDGIYTISSRTYDTSGDETYIEVEEDIPGETADGTLDQSTLFLYSVDPLTLADWSPFKRRCMRDNVSKKWYTTDAKYYGSLGQYVWIDKYMVHIDPNLITRANIEPLPNKFYVNGWFSIQPMPHRQWGIRIRYCHHTSGEMYSGDIILPASESTSTYVGRVYIGGVYHSEEDEDDEIVVKAALNGNDYYYRSYTGFTIISA